MKIATVVVTYNRLQMLKECIESLRLQTRKPDAIIVINNGSTDGSTEWLNEQKDLEIIHQENLGSSGGFYKGIEHAFQEGYDWVWVMDDDAEPLFNCLENCVSLLVKSNADVIAPLVIKSFNSEVDLMHRGSVKRSFWNIRHEPHILKPAQINTSYFEEVDFISFVGPIYSRKVIEKVGFPKKEFFLHYDDFEYSLRIKDAGFKMVLGYSASILHKEVAHTRDESVIWKIKMGEPIPMEKLMTKYFSPRNGAYLMRERLGFLPALIISVPLILKEAIRHLLVDPSLLLSRVSFYTSAVKDGLTGKFDNKKPSRLISKFRK